MAARLGVEPIEIASDHAVFALQPSELAAVGAAMADPGTLGRQARSRVRR